MNLKFAIVLFALAVIITGCSKKHTAYDKTPYDLKECRKQLQTGRDVIPAMKIDKIVIYKSKKTMYLYKQDKIIQKYKISLGKNGLKGHKIAEGDYKTPEGSYCIVSKKCDPRLYRSMLISYPDAQDIARAKAKGVKPGGYITIHGQPKWNSDGRGDAYTLKQDWTEGCIAIPNKAIDFLWSAVAPGVKIEIYA
ncbi:MAG: L,D-transpeptidase family protein [Sulfurovaceae bacterium]|nr:L,D-transpeptidase family protein [Sulfurovaceae bacterium]